MGSLFSKELGQESSELPNFVAVAPYTQFSPGAYGPGFLGPKYAPLVVGDGNRVAGGLNGMNYDPSLGVKNLVLLLHKAVRKEYRSLVKRARGEA